MCNNKSQYLSLTSVLIQPMTGEYHLTLFPNLNQEVLLAKSPVLLAPLDGLVLHSTLTKTTKVWSVCKACPKKYHALGTGDKKGTVLLGLSTAIWLCTCLDSNRIQSSIAYFLNFPSVESDLILL